MKALKTHLLAMMMVAAGISGCKKSLTYVHVQILPAANEPPRKAARTRVSDSQAATKRCSTVCCCSEGVFIAGLSAPPGALVRGQGWFRSTHVL